MTAKRGMRIGELAVRSGRSAHSIRWYDAQGLLPGVLRDGAGHRVFSPRHVEWLALLDRLRSTGMSIAQMRTYASLVRQGRSSIGSQRQLLEAHRERVVATMAAWDAALELIDAKLDFYAEWIASGERPAGKAVARKVTAAGNAAGRRRQPGSAR